MNSPKRRLVEDEDNRYRLLVDAITDYAIYMLDVDGFITSWNAGARRFKGYTTAEIVGEHFSKFYTEDDQRDGIPQLALKTAATEGRFEKEGWRVRKNGNRFWAHVIIDPVKDPNGNVVGFAKITRDLTERKTAQEELEKTQQALFQAQKLEAIGKLTGGVAHDFNNLLTAIGICLELVEKRLPDDDVRSRSLLKNALDGVSRGTTLTQRMLAFARRQELRIDAVSLPVLVAGLTGLLSHTLGPQITLQVDVPVDLPFARSDANQLETALLNLAINARDAMNAGGVIGIAANVVRIGLEDQLDLVPGEYIRIAVSDDGCGMDASTLARATEPFFTTKGVGKGTGLGLSMVQGLTEQSGGKLLITSVPQQGTTVEIILPTAQYGALQTSNQTAAQATPPLIASQQIVLIVDDDQLVLTSAAAVVEDLGYIVLTAGSGSAALEIVTRRADIAVVMTDQVMPHMTGVQLADAIATVRPTLPIILATGYAELDSLPTGNLRRLSKPFSRQEVAKALVNALGSSKPERLKTKVAI